MRPDWTVAMDDLLRQWCEHCTLCGCHRPGRVGIWEDDTRGVAYILCHACRQVDGETRVLALLDKRYGAQA